MFTAPDHPDMWAPPLNFVTILLARLKDRFQKQIALISVWKVKRYLCSRRSFSQIWNCYKTRYNHYTLYIPLVINILYILSPLISAFNFPLNWQAKLYTTTLLWQHSTGSSPAHAETGREAQWSIKLSPRKAGRARWRRQCRATLPDMDLGITFWGPQTLLKSRRCLSTPLICTLFIPASSTSRTQIALQDPHHSQAPTQELKLCWTATFAVLQQSRVWREGVQSQAFWSVLTGEAQTLHNSTPMSIYLCVMEWYLEFIVLQHPFMLV